MQNFHMTFWQISAFNKVNNKAPNTKKQSTLSFVVRTKSQNWIMCKGLLSKCCFVFHELSYTDVVSGIYNNVIVEWKSKNKTCPFGELLFEKSLCSSSDARRFPRWLKFHFSFSQSSFLSLLPSLSLFTRQHWISFFLL